MGKDVLFEIGLEELPARFINDAEKQLGDKTAAWLKEERISYEGLETYQTPRRLAVLIRNAADQQETIEEEAKGPAAKIAKDEEGNWSKAALGFARGQGKSPEDFYEKEVKGVSYLHVRKTIEGKPVQEVLPGFADIITSIQFGKNMRWGNQTMRYARPIRWLVALYGEAVIPFEIAGVTTGKKTYGHRFLGSEFEIGNSAEYAALLEKQFVIPTFEKRKNIIVNQIHELEKENGYNVPIDEELLEEVVNLVEYPTAFAGSFDSGFLDLPDEVLITSMKEHQRYFPVKDIAGKLLPIFIAVRNGTAEFIETVCKGNEKVLRARLSDADFFFEEDKKGSISENMDKLKTVVFQEKLGTYYEKAERVSALAVKIAHLIGCNEEDSKTVQRAGLICKFDLVTNMVGEFTELQGIMGEKYARHFGESEAVAVAIREHYMPVQASGDLPETLPGSVVAIADKLDTVAGTIAAGLIPSGSQDPYGLRRQAAGIMRIIDEKQWAIPVEQLLDAVLEQLEAADLIGDNAEETRANVKQFFNQRAAFLLKEAGIEYDIVEAVTAGGIGIFSYAREKATVLAEKRHEQAFKSIEEALVRVLNLSKEAIDGEVDSSKFKTDSERALHEQVTTAKKNYITADKERNAADALDSLAALAPYIADFFDNNMVMADDPAIKQNRLLLLGQIASMVRQYADLAAIEWKQQF
ncbi:glycine--tRNA ligase subunit beta [Aciduricibacillus chroicocephali]|uniref:Glycine--tRNA ligase beta subunit n=1 Tax=Aciduricibacillus chroicocephali TaxID=3054939 RepID=A0ABY9KRZ3_9BACI|nr:glycine--tRNA ligase subunit beta [Bacillaceae bacterium 44XB]